MRKILALVLAAASAVIVATAGTAAADQRHDCAQYSVTAPVRITNTEDDRAVEAYWAVLSVKACFDGPRIRAYWDKKVDLAHGWNANRAWHVVSTNVYETGDLPVEKGWTIRGNLWLKFSIPSVYGSRLDDAATASPYLMLHPDGRCVGGEADRPQRYSACTKSPLPKP